MIQHVEISNQSGRILRGYATIPNDAKHIVVFFHGYTGNKTEHGGHFRNLARRLEEEGIASLRIDYACNGESDGEFAEFRFDEALDDAKRMIDYAHDILLFRKISLLGFSMGGWVASLVSNYYPIEKLVLWSPSGGMAEKVASSFSKMSKLENGNGFVSGFEISSGWVESLKGYDAYEMAKNCYAPVLIIHGTQDLAVAPAEGKRYAESFPNTKILLVEGAGHGYDRYEEREILYKTTIEFLK